MLRRLTITFACLGAPLLFSTIFGAEAARPPGAVQTPAKPAAPAPRKDLTGTWGVVGFSGVAAGGIRTSPPTALGKELMAANMPGDGPRKAPSIGTINDPHTTKCDPAGFPRTLLFELRPFQVVQTPNQILMLYAYDQRWRVIWMDGRKLSQSPEPRWFGYSVGRWEDDSTLVVESNGTVDNSWLDNAGNPHSADMRVTERYHRVDADNVELTVTINDPAVYETPFNARDKLKIARMPADTTLPEMVCVASEAINYREMMSAPPSK
jgi:hypothetical protein